MSLAADSPVSSSDEDSAAYLDAELDYMSSGSSPRGLEEEEEEEHGQEAAAESESKSDIESKRIKRAKLEELKSVQDSMGSTSCRSREMKLEASSSKNICTHPGSSGDMCTVCGQRLNEKSGVTFRCIHKI
uniref:Uncharacterized protein n=1 Tax=Rhizophora mucronata TaxID=61149 RepID=A0A2P2JTV0_RHIMU